MSALLLAVAACGGQGTGTAPGPASSPSPAPASPTPTSALPSLPASPPPQHQPPKRQPTQGLVPGDTAPAAGQVDASALPAGYPQDITLADGGSTVVLHGDEAGCDQLSAAAGEQTPSRVVVVVTMTKPPHGRMCPLHVSEISLPVRLAEPLGGRQLVLRPGS